MYQARSELNGSISTSPTQCGVRMYDHGPEPLPGNPPAVVVQDAPPLTLRYTWSKGGGHQRSIVLTTIFVGRCRSTDTPANPPCSGNIGSFGGVMFDDASVPRSSLITLPLVMLFGPWLLLKVTYMFPSPSCAA